MPVYDDEDNHREGHCSNEDSFWAAQCNVEGARFSERSLGQPALNYPHLPCGNVALDCPFINSRDRCVQGEFGCGTQSIRPPVVGAASCSTYWSSSEFDAALGERSLYFVSVIPLLHSSGRACYAQRRCG